MKLIKSVEVLVDCCCCCLLGLTIQEFSDCEPSTTALPFRFPLEVARTATRNTMGRTKTTSRMTTGGYRCQPYLLRGSVTTEELLREARRLGVQYRVRDTSTGDGARLQGEHTFYEVEYVMAYSPARRMYKVRWEGWSREWDSWIPVENFNEGANNPAIQEFWESFRWYPMNEARGGHR